MPIPLLLGLGLAATGVLGAAGHSYAKDTNKEAEDIQKAAIDKYEGYKKTLEKEQKECSSKIYELGKSKKDILDTSMNKFIATYKKMSSIQLNKTRGWDEALNFEFAEEDILQLQKLNSIYDECITSGATGAATGAIVSLAVGGALPVITTDVGIIGSSFLAGTGFTPLATIVAPVLFFSAFSASSKADENVEKAKKTRAEVNLAVEKMKVSEELCKALKEKSILLNGLINDLNKMFVVKTDELSNRLEELECEKVDNIVDSLSDEDIELVQVTMALAKAIKSIIDTPLATEDGNLSLDVDTLINDTEDFMEQIHCERKEREVKSDSDSVPDSIDDFIRLLSQQLERIQKIDR